MARLRKIPDEGVCLNPLEWSQAMSSYVNPTLADLTLYSTVSVRFPLMLNYRSDLSNPPELHPGI